MPRREQQAEWRCLAETARLAQDWSKDNLGLGCDGDAYAALFAAPVALLSCLDELARLEAEKAALKTAVAKFIACAGNDLCHENRAELAHAFGLQLSGSEWPCLPSEQEYAFRCLRYRQELYGHPGPGSDAEAYDAEIKRLREALRPFADYAGRVDSSASDSNPIDDACPPVGGYGEGRQINARPVPTLGDCRKAKETLNGAQG